MLILAVIRNPGKAGLLLLSFAFYSGFSLMKRSEDLIGLLQYQLNGNEISEPIYPIPTEGSITYETSTQEPEGYVPLNFTLYKSSTVYGTRDTFKIKWTLPSLFGKCRNGYKDFNWQFVDQENFAVCGNCTDTHSRTVLIWGDSHLLSVFDAIIVLTHHYNVCALLFCRPGCPPVAKAYVYFPDKERISERCQNFSRNILAFIQEKNITDAIFIARWKLYQKKYLLLPEKIPVPQQKREAILDDFFRLSINNSVNYFRSQSIRQHFVNSIPDFLFYHPDGIRWKNDTYLSERFYQPLSSFREERTRQFIFGLSDPTNLGSSPHNYSGFKRTEQKAAKFRTKNREVSVVDPLKAFCTHKDIFGWNGTYCAPLINKKNAYWIDGGHVNLRGALAMVPILEPTFADISETPPLNIRIQGL